MAAQRRRLGAQDRRRDRARARPLPVHHGPGGARARGRARGVLRRPPCGHLRERHRRAAAGADGQGDRPRRRGDLPVLHLPRDRRGGGAASARRRCSPMSTRRPSTSIRQAASAPSRPRARPASTPKAIIPVDLFGQPADHDAIAAIAAAENLFVLDDAAQGFGATYQQPQASARSALRDHDQLLSGQAARLLRRRRRDLHRRRRARRDRCAACACTAQGADQYDNVRIGTQRPARHHPGRGADREAEDLSRRDRGAQPDRAALQRRVSPTWRRCRACPTGSTSVWAQYTIRLPSRAGATRFAAALKAAGHPDRDLLSEAAASPGGLPAFPVRRRRLPVTERLAEEVISLPMHAYLDEPTQDRIIAAVRQALAVLSSMSSGLVRMLATHRVHSPLRQPHRRMHPDAGRPRHDRPHPHRRRLDAALARSPALPRDIMLAAILGAGPVADAFFVALRLPNHFRAIFAEGAFNAAFVPAYARIRAPGGAGAGASCSPTASSRCCSRARSCCWRSRWSSRRR